VVLYGKRKYLDYLFCTQYLFLVDNKLDPLKAMNLDIERWRPLQNLSALSKILMRRQMKKTILVSPYPRQNPDFAAITDFKERKKAFSTINLTPFVNEKKTTLFKRPVNA